MERGQRIALLGAALVVAALAFLLLSGGDDDEDTKPTSTTQPTLQGEPTASVPAPKPKPAVETIRVIGGESAGGVKEITVEKDDTVRLEVRTADTAAEVHVHGYDLSKFLDPSAGSVVFRFKADIEGVFEIELEETKTPIAELTVEP